MGEKRGVISCGRSIGIKGPILDKHLRGRLGKRPEQARKLGHQMLAQYGRVAPALRRNPDKSK